MAKQSKNQAALESNQNALEKAKADLAKAQKAVLTLSQKIPELERAVEALRVLCGEKPTKPTAFRNSKTGEETPVRALSPAEMTAATSNLNLPPELLVMEPLPSMDGITSIPAPREPKITPSAGNVAIAVRNEKGFV